MVLDAPACVLISTLSMHGVIAFICTCSAHVAYVSHSFDVQHVSVCDEDSQSASPSAVNSPDQLLPSLLICTCGTIGCSPASRSLAFDHGGRAAQSTRKSASLK